MGEIRTGEPGAFARYAAMGGCDSQRREDARDGRQIRLLERQREPAGSSLLFETLG